MFNRRTRNKEDRNRAISPVFGGALVLVLVILLTVVTATMAFGLLEETSPAPSARLEMQEEDGCNYKFIHVAGDRIDGNRTDIQGVADSEALRGQQFSAGDTQELDPVTDEITLLWSADGTSESYVIGRFDVEADDGDGGWGCVGTLYTAESHSIDSIDGNNGSLTTLSATTDANALGSANSDLTGDGTADIPFIDSNGVLKLTNSTNGTTTIANGSSISGTIEHSKTRLGVGTWNGSDQSVFFVDGSHDTIYRVEASSSPTEVTTPSNGAQAVSGIGDIDGDGADELIFADGSQQLRYLEPDGTTKNLDDGQTGSNNGIGSGALADFDGDGTVSVAAIDGSNDVKIAGAPTADGGEGTTIISAADARKAPPTAADIDDDGNDEIVYIGKDDGKLKYIDDVNGANRIHFVTDEDGNKIDGSEETGIV